MPANDYVIFIQHGLDKRLLFALVIPSKIIKFCHEQTITMRTLLNSNLSL